MNKSIKILVVAMDRLADGLIAIAGMLPFAHHYSAQVFPINLWFQSSDVHFHCSIG